jgi:hypothetical protein
LAGLVGSFVGTPFDRIKILMQVGGSGGRGGRGTGTGSKSSSGSSGSNGTGSGTRTRTGEGGLGGNRGAPALKTSRPSPHLRPRVPFSDLRRALSDAGGLRGLYAGHGMNVVREAVFGAIYLGGEYGFLGVHSFPVSRSSFSVLQWFWSLITAPFPNTATPPPACCFHVTVKPLRFAHTL